MVLGDVEVTLHEISFSMLKVWLVLSLVVEIFLISQLRIQLYLFKLGVEQRSFIIFSAFLGISKAVIQEDYTVIVYIGHIEIVGSASHRLTHFLIKDIHFIHSAKICQKVASVALKVILMSA